MTWHNSTTGGVQPGMTERPIAPKEGTPAGRPALSVDKHEDLTRRTHHQDPCGREGPFPRNLTQVTMEGRPIISQLQDTPSFAQTQQQHTYPSSSLHTYETHASQFPGIKKSVRRNLP